MGIEEELTKKKNTERRRTNIGDGNGFFWDFWSSCVCPYIELVLAGARSFELGVELKGIVGRGIHY